MWCSLVLPLFCSFFSSLNFISCHYLLLFTNENLWRITEKNTVWRECRKSMVTLLKKLEPQAFCSLAFQADKANDWDNWPDSKKHQSNSCVPGMLSNCYWFLKQGFQHYQYILVCAHWGQQIMLLPPDHQTHFSQRREVKGRRSS